jgi:hypothetical protein
VSAGGFSVVASAADFGGSLLTDVEFFLDHAAEHQVTLFRDVSAESWRSPAWVAVTMYYWSFFLALALTRLLGRTAWYLTPRVAEDLHKLCGPTAVRSPGGGSYRLVCGPMMSATDREITLRKSKSRLHDVIWSLFFSQCREKLTATRSESSDPEDRLYTALVRSGNSLGDGWPSNFRNAVNYNPGFAYTAARGKRCLGSFSYLMSRTSMPSDVLIGRLEDAVAAVSTSRDVQKLPNATATLLAYLSLSLYSVTTDLYDDLLERHRLDGRWRTRRRRFLKAQGLFNGAGTWPS